VTAAGTESTVARNLLAASERLMRQPAAAAGGTWPRAAALLARQALEVAVKTFWAYVAPGTDEAPMRAQLLCLEGWLPAPVARDAYQAWAALSRAAHHHAYELPPTADELAVWRRSVAKVLEATERVWGRG
jgi:hypothetical protein